MLSAVYVNQMNFNVKLSTKVGGQAGGQPRNWGAMSHPAPPPFKIATAPHS